ncbi:hypothetical protein COCVIDRAFT_95107, partial [Bipolaris victoriae FI3]
LKRARRWQRQRERADASSRLLLYLQYGYYGREGVVRGQDRTGQGRAGRAVWHSLFRPGRPMRRQSFMGARCGIQLSLANCGLAFGGWQSSSVSCVPFILPPLQPLLILLLSIECSTVSSEQ